MVGTSSVAGWTCEVKAWAGTIGIATIRLALCHSFRRSGRAGSAALARCQSTSAWVRITC